MLGSILIIAGLYAVLWGKYKEEKEKNKLEIIPDAIKSGHVTTNFEAENIQLQKTEANIKVPVVSISLHMSDLTTKTNQMA